MKSSNGEEERLRVVKAAADISLEDIGSQVCNTTEYPPTDNFLNDVETVIPQTLLNFHNFNTSAIYQHHFVKPNLQRMLDVANRFFNNCIPNDFKSI